jgi:uncharacterized protein (DUF1778 family)
MKKLRQFEIDAICDEAYKLIKEKKEKQMQIVFDEFEGKESLLELVDKLIEKNQQIKQLEEEKEELSNKINQSKDILRQKGMYFNVVHNNTITYDISVVNMSYIRSDIHREIILQGIDDSSSVKDFIKELVDKFKD